jgi:16S rRNA (adenine1518-N6/adenine1519-N6)-dimethyltransferase
MEIKPKKSLGQNFLIDKSVLQDIVSAIDPQKGETIVEIGPGHGELTNQLLEAGASVIAIEKDRELAKQLASIKYDVYSILYKNLEVITGDALEVLRNLYTKYKIPNTAYKLVGNIHYYITGQLFRIIGELKDKPSLIVFMIQKEVAERICAGKNNRSLARTVLAKGEVSRGMNLLAASIQIWAKPEIVRYVSRDAFNPKPKVDSAVIKLKTYDRKLIMAKQIQNYYKLLHVVFRQPRKTILNNLRQMTNDDKQRTAEEIAQILKQTGINPTDRPQDLRIENLISLSRVIF